MKYDRSSDLWSIAHKTVNLVSRAPFVYVMIFYDDLDRSKTTHDGKFTYAHARVYFK